MVYEPGTLEPFAFGWFEGIVRDLRFGLRQLHRNLGFATMVALTLALGIGANTAIFSLMDAVMLRTLPVRSPEHLVLLSWVSQKKPAMMAIQSGYSSNDATGRWTSTSFSYPAFEQIRAQNQAFSSVFGFAPLGTAEFSIAGHAYLGEGELVTGDYFSGLGVTPELGRTITDRDEQPKAPLVVVISYSYWSRYFGNSTKAIGSQIVVNGVPSTVIGVMPSDFFGVQPGRHVDVWIPFVHISKLFPYGIGSTPGGRSPFSSPDWWWLMIMGRLRPGIERPQATAQVETIFQQNILASVKTSPNPQFLPHLELKSGSRGLAMLRQQFSKPLWVLMIAVALVLLIACANVASLLLARSAAREKEMSVRLSIGARRSDLIRQMLTESVLLAGIGGTVGLLFAFWGGRTLLLLVSSGGQTVNLAFQLDAKVLGFNAAVSLLTGMLFGLVPAWRSTHVDLSPALKETSVTFSFRGDRKWWRQGNFLIVGQVALSLLLLIGAGLFLRTLDNLEHQNLGFDQAHLLLFSIDPTTHGYTDQRLVDLYSELLARFQALPGVSGATLSEVTLISGNKNGWPISIQGYVRRRDIDMGVDFNSVGPSFFSTMGIRLLTGRGVRWQDTMTSPKVAVVNKAFADHFFAAREPIGQRFIFQNLGDPTQSYGIVGIVADAKYASLRDAVRPTVYLPWTQVPYPLGGMNFELRTEGAPLALVSSVREAVHNIDAELPVADFKTQSEEIAESLVQERLFTRLSIFFGGLAALLVCVGLYALIAFSVVRRTHEVAVRIALGAQRRKVLRMLITEGMILVALGIIIGVACAVLVMRYLSSLLFDLKPVDPTTFIVVCAFLSAVAFFACYIPSRRAVDVDVTAALRYE